MGMARAAAALRGTGGIGRSSLERKVMGILGRHTGRASFALRSSAVWNVADGAGDLSLSTVCK